MFWAVSLLTYNLIILCLIIQDPSKPFRVYILTDKIFTIPRYIQIYTYDVVLYFISLKTFTSCLRLSSVPAVMLLKLPTVIGFAENQLSRSVLSFTTYHNSSDIFATITRSDLYNPDYGKITGLRV